MQSTIDRVMRQVIRRAADQNESATLPAHAYQRYTHGIGMMKPQASAATIVRQKPPAAAVEDDLAPRAVDVAADPPHRAASTQAQPMMVMTEIANSK